MVGVTVDLYKSNNGIAAVNLSAVMLGALDAIEL